MLKRSLFAFLISGTLAGCLVREHRPEVVEYSRERRCPPGYYQDRDYCYETHRPATVRAVVVIGPR
jgi:hypothetical protein